MDDRPALYQVGPATLGPPRLSLDYRLIGPATPRYFTWLRRTWRALRIRWQRWRTA